MAAKATQESTVPSTNTGREIAPTKDRRKTTATPSQASRTAPVGSNPISRANAAAKGDKPSGLVPPKWRHRINLFTNFAWSWFAAFIGAFVSIAAFALATKMGTAAALVVLALPALFTFWRVPTSRRKVWRWAIVWVIAEVSVTSVQFQMLLFGEAWVIRQMWFVERPYVVRKMRGKGVIGWYGKQLAKLDPRVSARYQARESAKKDDKLKAARSTSRSGK